MDKAYLIFQGENGIGSYELLCFNAQTLTGELGKPLKFELKGEIISLEFNDIFECLEDLHSSIYYNFKIAQKEMLLNLKAQGIIKNG